MLAGYATGQSLTRHAFSFDARRDSPNVEVLDYRYGNSKLVGTRAEEPLVKDGQIAQMTNVTGPMLRGDSLYVKWRIKKSGEVYEDTVDLRSRLPTDITNHRLYFVVKGTQLYVYLISPETEKRAESELPGPLRKYSDLKVTTIYPDAATK
jgi:hypothetical protein